MTKKEAEVLIVEAELKAKRLSEASTNIQQSWWNAARKEEDQAREAIRKKYETRYAPKQKLLAEQKSKAYDAITNLRIKYAATLCGLPIDSLMIEWRNDWSEWVKTGRTGILEIYLHGAEWPENYNRPQIGTVIIRICGKKTGKPTLQACRLNRETGHCKYKWAPEGVKP